MGECLDSQPGERVTVEVFQQNPSTYIGTRKNRLKDSVTNQPL